jgi:hypothetical protein
MYKIVQIKSCTILVPLIVVLGIFAGTASLATITTTSPLFLYQNVWAQAPPTPTAPLPTATSNSATPSSAGGGAGALPQMVVQQGIVTSSTDPLPGHEAHQSATILRLRDDNAVYSGTLTFTSTKPVEVQVLHRNMTTTTAATGGTNATAPTIPEEFGALSILQLPGNNGAVSISNIIPQFPEDATTFVASIPFSGNAVALHNIEGEPFAATYTVTAGVVGAADRADNIGPPPAPEEEEEEEEEG